MDLNELRPGILDTYRARALTAMEVDFAIAIVKDGWRFEPYNPVGRLAFTGLYDVYHRGEHLGTFADGDDLEHEPLRRLHQRCLTRYATDPAASDALLDHAARRKSAGGKGWHPGVFFTPHPGNDSGDSDHWLCYMREEFSRGMDKSKQLAIGRAYLLAEIEEGASL